MVWERIGSPGMRGRRVYGEDWARFPAISVAKNGLTVNTIGVGAFGLEPSCYVRILFDSERRAIGLKRCVNGEDVIGAYKMSKQGECRTRPGTSALSLSCKEIAKRCPDAVGYAFRAHLNPGEHVIECVLSPANMTK